MTTTLETTLTAAVNDLNDFIRRKQLAAGVERFYDDDVIMIESSSEQTRGKKENIERERAFESGLTQWDADLKASITDEATGLAFNHWTIHFHHAQFGSGVLEQIAMQQWRDGRIVREAFYKL